MKKHVFALLALASTVMGAGLQGSECCDEGFYVGGFAGVNFLQNIEKHGVDAKFKTGFAGGIAGGYKFRNNVRGEAEFAYRRNTLKSISFDDESLDLHGSKLTAETYSVMGNVYYDFDMNCWGCMSYGFTPYIGVGAGWAQNKIKASSHDIEISGKDSGFAYQGIAGVSYRICHKTDLGLEYRYFASKHDFRDHTVAITAKRYF